MQNLLHVLGGALGRAHLICMDLERVEPARKMTHGSRFQQPPLKTARAHEPHHRGTVCRVGLRAPKTHKHRAQRKTTKLTPSVHEHMDPRLLRSTAAAVAKLTAFAASDGSTTDSPNYLKHTSCITPLQVTPDSK